ncbi:MAG: TIGR02270 family protein [Pseudomonas sp.]|uniref:TIGR02270 family protein n=1 Tax=Pseudomonas sp. TaxID=306 RepID=UPI0030F008F4
MPPIEQAAAKETSRLIIPPVLDQHAEEASFLAILRDYAVGAPNYDLSHLGKLDKRIDAHLDGLHIAGLKGLNLLLEQLRRNASGEVFAATVLAFQMGNSPALSTLGEHLRTNEEGERYFAAALGWLQWNLVQPWVERLLVSPEPLFRRLGLAACGMHRHDPGPALLSALGNSDPSVLARAARTAGELRRRDLMQPIRLHRLHADDALRFWANWATAQMGDEEALPILQQFAERPGRFQQRALHVVLAWQARDASMAWIRRMTQIPEQRRIAIKATGLFGDPVALPWLLQQMQDVPMARVAGEAFNQITGIDLAMHDLERRDNPDYDAGPSDDPNDPNVAMDEDENLPWPDAGLIQTWLHSNGGGLQNGTAYLLGEPFSEAACWRVLTSGNQRQRLVAAGLLARYVPTRAVFPVSAPVHRQRRLLNA